MKISEYRARVAQPIAGEQAVGERLREDPLLDFIESQMIKVGSLSHAEVQWHEVESSALKLLSERTKDLKILTILLQCLQNQATAERYIASVLICADFIREYWESCFPAPGKRGALPRRKFFSQIVQRSRQSAEKLEIATFDFEQKQELQAAVEEWLVVVQEAGLPDEDLVALVALIQRKTTVEAIAAEVTTTPESLPASKSAPERAVTTATTASLHIDGSSERATKQALLKVADFLSEMGNSVADLQGLRLRRFAIWFSITSLPDANGQGETQLMPVSGDRVREYEEQWQRGADLALWRKVEQSLTVAPYWLDGHYLSAQIAEQLGEPGWAAAIMQEVVQFTERLPQLTRYCFKGGAPFMSEATQSWLAQAQQQSGQSTQSPGSWDEKRRESMQLAHEGGVSVALAMLNDGLNTAKEPRERCYWQMLGADVMREHQLGAMAGQTYHALYQQFSEMKVADWEPSLIQYLAQQQAD
ncbi:type VI secretion system protein TssA [Celerinatantimonas sp. YJH-8]|uniref:type VI secretion system protein TssA n=1 Tax=Celerinatantimonas sp. YJH-8 TaxID=3228714 RepID=UPI0038C8D3E1